MPMHVDGPLVWVPESDQDRELVRQQMERLLETSHFRNSRRYPALFRFIIEEALAGRGEYLKERLIGVQVFGRPADYDTAADPVVRVTIAEIRKRIAQYYHDEAHDNEMRIELMPGSYEPEFRPGRDGKLEHIVAQPQAHHEVDLPAESARQSDIAARSHEITSQIPELHTPETAPVSHVAEHSGTASRLRWFTALGVAVCLIVGVACTWWRETRTTASEELWAPLVATHKPVMMVMPAAGGKFLDNAQPAMSDPWISYLQLETGGENVVFADVTAVMRISNLLAGQHAESHLRLNNATTLDDLRQGPAVLIGGMDNQWALRVLNHLRYNFAGSDADAYWIRDRTNPEDRRWSLDLKVKIPNVTRDFALIARVHDESTGQPLMVVAGIGMSGTASAGELLSTPAAIDELRRRVGEKAFKERDFEAVLSTDVVNGIAGAARILTVDVP
jgi:hypothetical protein